MGIVKEFGDKATVDVKAVGVDSERGRVVIYAVFADFSDYVYVLDFNAQCKITAMTKVWNDLYAAQKYDPTCEETCSKNQEGKCCYGRTCVYSNPCSGFP